MSGVPETVKEFVRNRIKVEGPDKNLSLVERNKLVELIIKHLEGHYADNDEYYYYTPVKVGTYITAKNTKNICPDTSRWAYQIVEDALRLDDQEIVLNRGEREMLWEAFTNPKFLTEQQRNSFVVPGQEMTPENAWKNFIRYAHELAKEGPEFIATSRYLRNNETVVEVINTTVGNMASYRANVQMQKETTKGVATIGPGVADIPPYMYAQELSSAELLEGEWQKDLALLQDAGVVDEDVILSFTDFDILLNKTPELHLATQPHLLPLYNMSMTGVPVASGKDFKRHMAKVIDTMANTQGVTRLEIIEDIQWDDMWEDYLTYAHLTEQFALTPEKYFLGTEEGRNSIAVDTAALQRQALMKSADTIGLNQLNKDLMAMGFEDPKLIANALEPLATDGTYADYLQRIGPVMNEIAVVAAGLKALDMQDAGYREDVIENWTRTMTGENILDDMIASGGIQNARSFLSSKVKRRIYPTNEMSKISPKTTVSGFTQSDKQRAENLLAVYALDASVPEERLEELEDLLPELMEQYRMERLAYDKQLAIDQQAETEKPVEDPIITKLRQQEEAEIGRIHLPLQEKPAPAEKGAIDPSMFPVHSFDIFGAERQKQLRATRDTLKDLGITPVNEYLAASIQKELGALAGRGLASPKFPTFEKYLTPERVEELRLRKRQERQYEAQTFVPRTRYIR